MVVSNLISDYFFSLLRSGIWGSVPVIPKLSEEEWQVIYLLANQQTVTGIIVDGIEHLPSELRPNRITLLKFIGIKSMIRAKNEALNAFIQQIAKKWHDEGLNPIMIKGQGIALLYRNPLSRSPGDIDLFVPREKYRIAVDLALSENNIVDKDFSSGSTNIKYKDYTLEIHNNLSIRSIFSKKEKRRRWFYNNVQNTDKQVLGIDVPNDVFNSIFVFNHMLSHFMSSGVGLRQLCDWAMVLHHATQSDKKSVLSDKLYPLLKSFGLLDPWQKIGFLLVRDLGLPKDEFPLFKDIDANTADFILERILDEGNFGHYSDKLHHSNNYLLQKWYAFSDMTRRNKMLFNFFPLEAIMNQKDILGSMEQICNDIKKRINGNTLPKK